MQTLILILILWASSSWPAGPKPTHFQLSVTNRYHKQTLRIFMENEKFKCKTENQPTFTLSTDPFQKMRKEQYQLDKKSFAQRKSCRDFVVVRNTLNNKISNFQACLDNPQVKEMVKYFNSICRY